MLLCAVTTWAQVEVGNVYKFESGRDNTKTLSFESNKLKVLTKSTDLNLAEMWAVEAGTVDGTFALRNMKNSQYVVPKTAVRTDWTLSETKDANNDLYISIENTETGAVSIRFSEESVAGTHNGAHHESWYHTIVSWEATAEASQWVVTNVGTLEEVEQLVYISLANEVVATASNTRVGAYTLASVVALSEALDTYNADQTIANVAAVKTAYNDLLANGEKVTLAAHELFTLKCYDTNRGYMVYSTVEGMGSETQVYLAGTNKTEYHAAADAEGVYKEWATVVVEGKTYIYNAQNKKFISADNVVKFTTTAPAAIKFVDINNGLNEVQFEADNKYLSYSPGWGADCVRREVGTDEGCMFYIDKTGETASVETIAAIESTFLNGWKEQIKATLDYVGGYSSSLVDAIDAVSTFDGKNAFVQNNEKVAFAPGYYYIQHTGTKKYATFNGTNFVAASVETPTLDNIMQFVEEEGVTKLKVANAGKYVTLADAPAVSQVASDFADGNAFTIEIKENAECTVKGGAQVMRTENNGDINYWWGDTNTKWYLIPVSEVSVTINEFASICLPFAVETTGDVKAYAVEGTNNTHALLAEKADIPANQGAILKGNGTYTLNIVDAAEADWTNNKLAGTTTNSYIAPEGGAAYVLANGENGIGLYLAALNCDETGAEGETHFMNNANKAYLVVDGADAAASYSFNFDWAGTTGIEGVTAEGAQDGAIYDITGRRVKAITAPGIYIVNGRKVVK